MTSKTNDQLLVEMALSRGYLLQSDLMEIPESLESSSQPLETPWGARIQRLIQRGRISVTVVEQLATELRQVEAARTIGSATAQSVTTSASSLYPIANWDKYQFLSMLGQGGMGVVFKARDRKLGRLVALKFLSGTDPVQTQRFLQEARAQAQLDHPNICKIYEIGEVQGKPYIAMHFVDGLSLDLARPSLSMAEKVRLLREVAEAVHIAHCQDVIHRDIKPSNIMVEQTAEGSTRAILMDFGLARTTAAGQALTMTGEVLGTPAYMSPEQARGDTRNMDGRTDVYSLGATLYDLLAGAPPFEDQSVYDLLIKLNEEEARPLRSRNPSIPESLETICGKCLSKEPNRRYSTAQALADDLGRFLFDQRILAKKTSPWTRLLSRARRNKKVAALSLAFLTSVLSLLAYGVWTRNHARRLQEEARREAAEQATRAERLGQDIKDMEWLLRSSRQLPAHDLRPEMARVRQRMKALQTELASYGEGGRALAHYALGRGHLALHEYSEALTELNRAIAEGYRRPDVYSALGVSLGKHYERAMYEARLSGGGPWAQKQLANIAPKYLSPAIAALEMSRSKQTDSSVYLDGLLAYYQGNHEDALRLAQMAVRGAPWLYEAEVLSGEVYLSRALAARDTGSDDKAREYFKQAVAHYEAAAAIGRSDAQVYERLTEALSEWIWISASQGAPSSELVAKTIESSRQISVVDPDDWWGPIGEARAHAYSFGSLNSGLGSLERVKGCLTAAREALRRKPGDPYAAEQLAACLAQQAAFQSSAQEAEASITAGIDVLEPVLNVHPNFLWGRNTLGLLYNQKAMLLAARDPVGAKRILIEKAIPIYQNNRELDPSYRRSYQNILDSLDTMALLPLSDEDVSRMLMMSQEVYAACLRIDRTEIQCHNNYAILHTLLGWRAYLLGRSPEQLLLEGRSKFRTLAELGGRLLDAEQYLALNFLIEGLSRLRQKADPEPSIREFDKAATRCLEIAANDPVCRSLLVRKKWLEAELVPQRSLATLRTSLLQAELDASRNQENPHSLWVLADTHRRLAALNSRLPGTRDQHLAKGGAIVNRLLSGNPAHVQGLMTKARLYLLQAEVATVRTVREAAAQQSIRSFSDVRDFDPAIMRALESESQHAAQLMARNL